MSKETLGGSIEEVKGMMKVQEDFGKSLVPQVRSLVALCTGLCSSKMGL